MCRTLEMAALKRRGWYSEKFDNLGFHVHPYKLESDDWVRMGTIGPWIVTQFWRTEWDGIKNTTAKALIEGAAVRNRKLIVRVEDPAVFGSQANGDGVRTDDKWFNEDYLPFLMDVVGRIKGKAWGIQVFNEVNVRHQYVTGPGGGRITASDMMLLVYKVQRELEKHGLVALMPGTLEYSTNEEYVNDLVQYAGVYSGPLNLHIYTGRTGHLEKFYDKLSKKVGKRPVIVTEANGYWNESAEWRWLSIQNILRIVKERFNVIGFLVYCWENPPYTITETWGQKGTEVETRLREISTYRGV